MNREFRRLTPKDFDKYIDIYMDAYPQDKAITPECREKYYTRNLESMQDFEDVNFFGLFEEGKPIAQAKLIDFKINLFGKMRKATGLMALAVHPLEKKKGAARDMVKGFEKYAVESGANLTMLLPFREDFYRQMGYGFGTKLEEYHIETKHLPKSSHDKISIIPREDMSKILECHQKFVEKNHGLCSKFKEEVRTLKADDGRWFGYYDEGELKGYAIFDFINVSETNYTFNKMVVRELVYLNQDALAQLLDVLALQSDLAQTVVIRTGEPDFHHVLPSAQHVDGYYIHSGFMQTNVSAIGTMFKIVDIKRFVEETAHRKFVNIPMRVCFKIWDELSHEEKKFMLDFKDGKYSYSDCCERQGGECCGADVIVEMKLADFTALLMGSAEFAALARLGVAKVNNPERISDLDMLFHVEQKPFSNSDF